MVPPDAVNLGREAPRAPADSAPNVSPPVGLTNGLEHRSNGRMTGLVGWTNGGAFGLHGRGNGLVNGLRAEGRTNGLGYTNGLPLRKNPFGVVTNRDFSRAGAIVAALFVLTLVLAYILGTPAPAQQSFAVDGNFSEWASVPEYVDPQDTALGHVDLVAFRVQEVTGQLFVYGRTRSPLFPGPVGSSIYVLISDGDANGYAAPGLTADYVAEIYGWNGTLEGSVLREWRGAADHDNATAFQTIAGFPAAAVGGEFELALDENLVGINGSPAYRLTLVARADDVTDVAAIVGPTRGALLVDQRPLTSVVSSAAPVIELRLRALVTDLAVTDISVQVTGGGTATLPAFPILIGAGNESTQTITLNPGALPGGTLMTVRVTGVTATAGDGGSIPPTISGDAARVYVQAVPGGKVVDGLFGDWSNGTADPNDTTVPAPVDILESATALGGSDFFLFVRTEGAVLAGAVFPERRVPVPGRAVNASSPPAPVRRVAGEDVLMAYVDTDDRDAIGMPFGGIIADRLLEVRGRTGRITSTALYAWNGTTLSWNPRPGVASVAFVGTRLEASASLSFLGATFNPQVVFAMSDWAERRDITDLLSVRGTRSAPGLEPTHGPSAESVNATLLTNVPAVDGRCNTSFPGEYAGASLVSTPQLDIYVGRRDDTQFVFICVRAKADITNNANDFGEIMFDTKHDGGTAPQSDDRLFDVFTNSNVIETWMGDGTGWVPCGLTCDPGDIARGRFDTGVEQYEFRIRYIDVWGTNAPSRSQVAGFAVVVFDAPILIYTWGSTAVDDTNPDSWGHIIIPEFPSVVVALAVALIIPLTWRRRTQLRADGRRPRMATQRDRYPPLS